jgi:hypothetical protein
MCALPFVKIQSQIRGGYIFLPHTMFISVHRSLWLEWSHIFMENIGNSLDGQIIIVKPDITVYIRWDPRILRIMPTLPLDFIPRC